jgi:hypothetical protein
MATQLELVREELRLRREIVTHELQCMLDDGADGDEIDAKIEECELIMARQEGLTRVLATLESPADAGALLPRLRGRRVAGPAN